MRNIKWRDIQNATTILYSTYVIGSLDANWTFQKLLGLVVVNLSIILKFNDFWRFQDDSCKKKCWLRLKKCGNFKFELISFPT